MKRIPKCTVSFSFSYAFVTYFFSLIEYNKGEVMNMGQTVYADVLFLINFSMDFLVLYLCAKLSRRRINCVRYVLAATLGGAYGVAALFLPQSGFTPLICDALSLAIICTVAFYSKEIRFRDFVGRCALFAGVSAILGGMMSAFYSVLNRSGLAVLEPDGGDDISVWIFALIAALGGAAAVAGGKRMKSIAAAKQSSIEIGFGSRTVRLCAMTDTGNLLTDPLSGRGVAICELDAVKELFPRELVEYWERGDIGSITAIPEKYALKLRYVPAKGAAGTKNSMLTAIVPDIFKVICEGKEVDADVLIAPVPTTLSAGESRALLPPGII